MELKTFIEEALVQISEGIQAANETVGRKLQHPDGCGAQKLYALSPGRKQEQGNGVHFDVAITSTVDGGGQGATRIRLKVVEVDVGGKVTAAHQAVSRLQFSVTVDQWHG